MLKFVLEGISAVVATISTVAFKVLTSVLECISENIATIGTLLGFGLWRRQIYLMYFVQNKGSTLRPYAGAMLLAFALNFVLKIGPSLFHLVGLTLGEFWKGQRHRFLSIVLGCLIQLLVGVCVAAYILNSWYHLTLVSECLPNRSCEYPPWSWILEGKYLVCPKLNSFGGTVYYEMLCEDIFDLMPFFGVIVISTNVTLVITILQTFLKNWRTAERLQ